MKIKGNIRGDSGLSDSQFGKVQTHLFAKQIEEMASMDDWAEKEKVDVIIIPYHYVEPGVLDRLRGYSLKSLLDHTDKQVVVMEESGDMWLARQ